jgi:protoporphyrinogen oxidase
MPPPAHAEPATTKGRRSARIGVVGAGFSGLAAAYELALRGYSPVVLEAASEPGGLAGSFPVGSGSLERFYHHWFRSDEAIRTLVQALGLEEIVVYRASRTGTYFANKIYRLSTPLDVLRFPALPFLDRIRLGLTVLRARRVRDWREIEHLSAGEWLRRLGGHRAYELVWEPLLKGKFGRHAEDVSAAWFWAKLILRGGSRGSRGEEQLGYMHGGFSKLVEAMIERIRQSGGTIMLDTPATGLETRSGRVSAMLCKNGRIALDAVILTPALPIIADLIGPHVQPGYAERLRGVEYLANVCLILELDRSLSNLYWMNVNDPSFPFVGIIEHTNLDRMEGMEGRHLVYFSRYLLADDPMFGWSAETIVDFALPHIRRMFPDFDSASIRASHVWRARYAQPLVLRDFSKNIPDHTTPVSGLFIASMAQIYPEDRGTNYAVRDGRKVAVLADRFLSQAE